MIGSSLGGLTAARLAERDPRVVALVLLAPAFQLIARWRQSLGDGWSRAGSAPAGARSTTTRPAGRARVDFGFAEDAAAIDVGFPDVTRPDADPPRHARRRRPDRALAPVRRRAGPHVRLVELDDGHELVASLPRLLAEADRFLATLPG